MNQTISELTEKEIEWVSVELGVAATIVAKYSPADAGAQVTGAILDRAFKRWMESGDAEDPHFVNDIINGIGIAFGQVLTEQLPLRWVIATDQDGSDLAVFGLPGAGDILIYPANFVAKRWERREADFMERACAEIAGTVSSIQSQNAAKPWWRVWQR